MCKYKNFNKEYLVVLFIFSLYTAVAQNEIEHYNSFTKEEMDLRMDWWRQAKFGMFIHWGVYSVPAGMYKGEKVDRVSSWIMQHEHIPVEEYKNFAKDFNPIKYNPKEWADLANEAGMKYLVITAKHHEGFSLYDSKVTDWDVVDYTPYGQDLLAPLIESCRENNLKVGLYYSHAVDYVHPGGEVQSLDTKPGGHWDPIQKTKSMDEYFEDIVIPQVSEILSNYGEIDLLWWDGGGWYNVDRKRADMILNVTNKYPNVLMNNRLGGDYSGDWQTPEQYIPATGLDYDWETCMTMNDTWGYRSWDHNWKSTEDLIRNLVDIVSKGGNFLLNIGPKADGTIPEASVERLKSIGKWMDVNSESIYGTQASPFEEISWGRCTSKANKNITQLYLHVFDWPEDGKLKLTRLGNKIKNVFLLADKKKTNLEISTIKDEIIIELPKKAPDEICSVIRMDILGEPEIFNAPKIMARADIFYSHLDVSIESSIPMINIRYTVDGEDPTNNSKLFKANNPIEISKESIVKAALFKNGVRVSDVSEKTFSKGNPISSIKILNAKAGLRYEYFEGVWKSVPNFDKLESKSRGITYYPDISKAEKDELFGMRFSGYIKVPKTGIYNFYAKYNDACNISIGREMILNSKGRVMDSRIQKETTGVPVLLESGFHPITIDYFQRIDHAILDVFWSGPNFEKEALKAQVLYHEN